MTTVPKLSIIIPVLNEEKYLPTLLTDLSRQTYTDFEVIIVDGHSDDRTVEKARQFEHRLPKLTIISSDTRHVCFQRNLGAKSALADTLIFMDADNRIPTNFLLGLKYRHEQSKADFFTTWIKSTEQDFEMQAIDTVINLYLEIKNKTDKPFALESMFGANKAKFNKLKGFKIKTPNEGPELVNRALTRKMSFTIFRDPNYSYSVRRIKKMGTLKALGNVAQLELSSLLGLKLTSRKTHQLYPMDGGTFYENDIIRHSLLEKLKLKKHSDRLIKLARSLLFEE